MLTGVMARVSVRHIVDVVAAAIAFYCNQLDFHRVMHPAPNFRNVGSRRVTACGPRHPANAVDRLCSCRQRQGHRSGRSPPVPGPFDPYDGVSGPERLTL